MSASEQATYVTTYVTTYVYNSPGPAGPFKGRIAGTRKHAKGDSICAPFGAATVKSCRAVKP